MSIKMVNKKRQKSRRCERHYGRSQHCQKEKSCSKKPAVAFPAHFLGARRAEDLLPHLVSLQILGAPKTVINTCPGVEQQVEGLELELQEKEAEVCWKMQQS
jgi:hypothetical protein